VAKPGLIAIVMTLAASFMEVLDTTIVNVALPHIAGAMSANYDEATWTLMDDDFARASARPYP
jgi:DHA2 family multidrug resistance protein